MDRPPQACATDVAPPAAGTRLLGRLVLLGLLAWQGWLTLTLFGPDRPWQRLTDAQPVISGRHALHQYHGYLGAQAFRETGTLCCYDPAFQAGYPKTPVFDSDSRPAELFLSLAGGAFRPTAYKIGLAICCLAVPLFLAAAARGVGLGPLGACLVAVLGMTVWWGDPARELLEEGDLGFLLAGLALLLAVGMLVRFHRSPGLGGWLGLVVAGCVGWFVDPLLFATVVPLFLVYYLSAGMRHGLGWHAALLVALAVGGLANAFWLPDWVDYWWLHAGVPVTAGSLKPLTPQAVWDAPLWGDPADRWFALALVAAGGVGLGVFFRGKQRLTARLLGLTAAGFVALAILGLALEPLGALGTDRLLVPALWFAAIPAVETCRAILAWLRRWTGSRWRATALATVLLLAAVWCARSALAPLAVRATGTTPLLVGLGPERQALVDLLIQSTTTEARILWEDRPGDATAPRWAALLPLLTGRVFLGGLDPNACPEYRHAALIDGRLAGKLLADWTDAELEEFCRRYNVAWVVGWSPEVLSRFGSWNLAEPVAPVTDRGEGCLFALRRPRSFVLKGQARWQQADCRRICLAEVVPEDGKVVLSLHYQAGLQVSPSRVRIEREPDPNDPIPLLRLRTPDPVARIILTWEKR